MAGERIWRVYCETESAYVDSDWTATKPTTCPNSGAHTIDANATVAVAARPELSSTPMVTFDLFTDTADYKEYTNGDWEVVDDFTFEGTDRRTPLKFVIVASRPGSSDAAYCRLYDFTNSQVVAEISWTAAEKAKYEDDSLSNLPAGAAIFEIQVKKGSGDNARLHSAAVY